jgi:hypothetical protein
LRLNELNALRKQIEREYLEKVNLEDEIMEKMRSQLTMDKAAHYTKKLTGKRRDLTKQLVCLINFKSQQDFISLIHIFKTFKN